MTSLDLWADQEDDLAKRGDDSASFNMKPVRCPDYRVMVKLSFFLVRRLLSQSDKKDSYYQNIYEKSHSSSLHNFKNCLANYSIHPEGIK